jgi:hypothetical protein
MKPREGYYAVCRFLTKTKKWQKASAGVGKIDAYRKLEAR